MPLKWYGEQFKKDIQQQVDADAVGKFVVKEARRQLMAIKSPEWGVKYRRFVADLLTYEVDRDKKGEILIRVGVKRTPKIHSFERPFIKMPEKSLNF